MIVQVNEEIKAKLKKSGFSQNFLDNCLNSKFLAIEEKNSMIIGGCFVGGLLNSNGIEILEEFRGKGLGKKFLKEILDECKERKISFLTGVFKPSNAVSIKMHTQIGYTPLFTFFYNPTEGKEIIVMLTFNKKGFFLMKLFRIFNTKVGNFLFAVLFKSFHPFLKNLIAFSSNIMPQMDFSYSVNNFEKVEDTMKKLDKTS